MPSLPGDRSRWGKVVVGYNMVPCVVQHQFNDRIAQLVHTFPEDAVTSTGALFWSAPKRFPQPIKFDGGDVSHVTLCRAAAILKAQACGITLPAWYTSLEKVISRTHTTCLAWISNKSTGLLRLAR